MLLASLLLLFNPGPSHAACPAGAATFAAGLGTAETAHQAWAWEEFDRALFSLCL